MSTMYTVVLQTASSNGNDHMVHLRRAASESGVSEATKALSNGNEQQQQLSQSKSVLSVSQHHHHPEKVSAPSLRGLVMEYYGPGQRLREIYLASREGERVAVPITLAVQLSPKLRSFVDALMIESATRGRHDSTDKKRVTLDVPCSTDVLKTMVDFVTAKLELELKLSEEGIRLNEEQKKEHWRDYMYSRIAWRMDLDDFADDILQVADHLAMKSLYDLMKCCFRLRL